MDATPTPTPTPIRLRNRPQAVLALSLRGGCPSIEALHARLDQHILILVVEPRGTMNITGEYIVCGPNNPLPGHPCWYALVEVFYSRIIRILEEDPA